jgi:hypothetical protein
MPSVDVSVQYFNKNLVHAKNENELVTTKCLSILDWLQIDVPSKYQLKMCNLFPSITCWTMDIP